MKYSINLFPVKEQNAVDKLIYFSFHYLRYILVITQFVVICVFMYRFKVDQEIVDLKDGLNNKQFIVQATEPLIKEVEAVNKRIINIQSVLDKQDSFSELYLYFFTKVPSNISVVNLTLENNSMEVDGVTDDVNSVRMFYEGIKNENKFKVVDLQNVRRRETGYEFTLVLQNFTPKSQ